MRSFPGVCKYLFVLLFFSLASCAVVEEQGRKGVPLGLITTPATYYSTPKARYLGEKYKGNLDRLVEQIIRNPKTANLQFANNIASIGGIGFFTHSAVKFPDERYLEVILSTPETFETRGEFSSKLDRVFLLYGTELLSVLSADSAIYQEKEVSGYGLNLSWRKVAADARGPRVTLERAIVYFPKEKVRGFLTHQVSPADLLRQSAIFAVAEDGAPTLVSYRAPEPRQDFRPPIREENLADTKLDPEPKFETQAQASTLSTPVVPSVPVPDRQEAVREIPGQAQNTKRMAETKTSQPAGGKQILDERKHPAPRASTEDSTSATLPRPSQPLQSQPTTVPPKQAAPTAPRGQELDGDSETAAAEASERRPELSPRDPAEVETKPKSAPVVTETAGRSVAEMTPILPSISKAKPAEHAEPKDSAGSVQSKIRLGEIDFTNSKPERPLDLPDKAETTERPRAEPAADSTSTEERAGEPQDSPASVASKLAETAAPTPPVAQVAPQEVPRPAEPTSVPPVAHVAPQEVARPAEPTSVPPVAQVAPQEVPRPAEPSSVPPVAQVAPQEVPRAAETALRDPDVSEDTASSDAHEQLALLRPPPSELTTEKKPLARPVPKPLEGFVIQVGFRERGKAQHWAESMQRRGYAVSVTEAAVGSVRVRVGNFDARDEAERQLQAFRKDGLTGIVINLPQAFRPQVVESQGERP